ncbi:MAG: hypothetical protein L7F77_14515 [Candidatus Magnetominusculus sp. LBB02]|nr:hypothetical protein [Candidatus Magnetominusculus sp. LBB02]
MALLIFTAAGVSAAEEPAASANAKKFGTADINTTVNIDDRDATILSFSAIGTVDLMTILYPPDDGADNGTIEHVLVNGNPEAVRVEKTAVDNIDIKADSKYPKFASVNPNLALSTSGVEFEKAEADGLRFYFMFVLRDGCSNCDASGYARIAFDFSKDGTFTSATLTKLMRTKQPIQ